MISLALAAARKLGCVVVITGEEDVITDGTDTYLVRNGHPILTKVTGAGCLLSSVVGAFAAVGKDAIVEASAEALAFYGAAAEIAYEQTAGQGPGSFQVQFLNQLALVTEEIVNHRAKLQRLALA
ncbi:Hydroxyethylthiazole kinase [compost metagenome]